MSNNKDLSPKTGTLSLPKTAGTQATPVVASATPVVASATPEQVAAFLKANGLMVVSAPAEGANLVAAITPDRTLDNPVEINRPDLSRLPPPGERSSSPVQLPARTWGQPRFLTGR